MLVLKCGPRTYPGCATTVRNLDTFYGVHSTSDVFAVSGTAVRIKTPSFLHNLGGLLPGGNLHKGEAMELNNFWRLDLRRHLELAKITHSERRGPGRQTMKTHWAPHKTRYKMKNETSADRESNAEDPKTRRPFTSPAAVTASACSLTLKGWLFHSNPNHSYLHTKLSVVYDNSTDLWMRLIDGASEGIFWLSCFGRVLRARVSDYDRRKYVRYWGFPGPGCDSNIRINAFSSFRV
ncbi:uncharacterized protein BT62DRAFT_1075311 [Guyanagaster necrorhizus]|uniref:Uncharacterized protein n=1 Tax=Guyanagaster necrorhizus TaxID=856835 RepID=A0A9P7VTP7_9AGAR|nr:uncharacterized protein BT62DRAFT_1075311 [Guyanagaster necrorhizus MCA 3950]KAG7447223.1 hypothetical protein BT62DRAFT_1075311 [Guyanagaster necrorhizus MCA 3950]